MNGLVRAARIANPALAFLVAILVIVQVYLISEYIFGSAGALSTHRSVGKIVAPIELLVAATAVIGWRSDRVQLVLSLVLLGVGGVQIMFAHDLGSSPSVHAFHGALALAVLALSAQLGVRKRAELRGGMTSSAG